MTKQPQQGKAATTLHKRKSTRCLIARRILCFSFIPTSLLVMVKEQVNHYLPDRYIGCKRHNVFFGIFDFIQGDTVFALRFFQAHIRTEAEVFA